ncbi:MAG: hypothetical protein HYV37_01185 [Candidatus Levyibacteriota bacterium]|nr:MAG: hypothetical protein HYV37_01185 [Candidatus Levybacteria bacterium]
MKKLGILIVCFFVVGIFFFLQKKENKTQQVLPASDSIVPTKIPKQVRDDKGQEKKFLFVPYWGQTQDKIPNEFGDMLIYFGITPSKDGIDTQEPGFLGLGRFVGISEGRKTLLTIRMMDQDTNFAIIKDKKQQEKIMTQAIVIAKQKGFSGIVLDLEISSLPFATVTDQMNKFVSDFSKSAKKNNLTFSMMFFGDTFFKLRPYDVTVLRQYLDTVFVMAYDFSKVKGDPGPNFPFPEFTLMVQDFLNIVPKEKLVIVFGMFGYDWQVDTDGKSVGQARAVTTTVAKKQFVNQCLFKKCDVKRDKVSAETTITYIDNQGNNHIVWFEDEESVAKKSEFLKEKGIKNVGYWAYSYF